MLKVQDLLFPFFLQETLQSNLAFLEKEKEEFNPEGETRSNVLMVCARLCPVLPVRSPTSLGVQPFSPFILISFSRTTLLFPLSHPVHPIRPFIYQSHISICTSIPYLLPSVLPVYLSLCPRHIPFHTSVPSILLILPLIHPVYFSVYVSPRSFHLSIPYNLLYIHPFPSQTLSLRCGPRPLPAADGVLRAGCLTGDAGFRAAEASCCL